MSTEATLARHLQAFAGSVDTIMSDYAESSVLFTPDGPLMGLDQIRGFFEAFKANSPPELIPALTLLRQDIRGEIAYITWKADPFIPLATDTFDIVLLDVRLPDGTGLDLLPRLRAEGQASQPTIIVMSASVLPAQRADALDAGADGFIGKPYPARELLDALREARASRGLGE